MKLSQKSRIHRSGMTLLELTVVILVLLTLIGILFIGARAWKNGADRSACILTVRNAQNAIRAYANTRGLDEGANIPGGLSREAAITGPDNYFTSWPECPGGGSYGGQELTTIPMPGVVLMACNWGTPEDNHMPTEHANW
jgi:type II secretory pathway pseudopilin PulG